MNLVFNLFNYWLKCAAGGKNKYCDETSTEIYMQYRFNLGNFKNILCTN